MAISQKTMKLAASFIAAYPILPGHPGKEHIKLTSEDLDKFGIANGAYDPAAVSDADLNNERAKMVSRINSAGTSRPWLTNDLGFQLVVQVKLRGMPTVWMVKPAEVAVAHTAFALPDRNHKTIVNRALKVDKMYRSVDVKSLPKEERRALKDQQTVMLGMAQLQATIVGNQNAMLQKTRKMLEKVDPQHRLLPK